MKRSLINSFRARYRDTSGDWCVENQYGQRSQICRYDALPTQYAIMAAKYPGQKLRRVKIK